MQSTARRTKPVKPPADDIPRPPQNLPEEDGIPLESDWHRLAMNLLIEVVTNHFRGRDDFFVGGNLFIYFSEQQVRNRDYRGPDFFYVKNSRLNPPRRYWAVWDEGGKYPDLIIELTSPSTAEEDRTTKKNLYENTFHTHEFFIFDPESHVIQGWRSIDARYEEIKPNDHGQFWCEELGLWLGTWRGKFLEKSGVYPRFFDKQGRLVPIESESERHRAEVEKQRAELEKRRADAEKQRADAAEAKLARLKAQLSRTKKRKK